MLYKKGDKIIHAGAPITEDGVTYINPTPERYAEFGWMPYELPEDEVDIQQIREDKIAEIKEYDSSDAVNSFKFNDQDLWLDKATRVGLVNALNAEKALGHDTAEVGLGNTSYTVDCEKAIMMLYSLESYALKCYNKTLAHINAVNELKTVEEVENYDFTQGYPERPEYII